MQPHVHVACPGCQKRLRAPAPGKYVCPACQTTVHVTAGQFAAVASSAEPRAELPQPGIVPATGARNRRLAIVGAVAAVLMVLVLWVGGLLLRRPAPTNAAPSGTAGSKPSDKDDSKQAVAKAEAAAPIDTKLEAPDRAPRQKRRRVIFDEDLASTAGSPDSTEPRPALPSDTKVAPGRQGWTKDAWGAAFQEGEFPLLDGMPVLAEVLSQRAGGGMLVLPAGRHLFQSSGEAAPEVRTVSRAFAEFYAERAAALQNDSRWSFAKLAEATRPTAGVFQDPLLPHFWGNYFWQERKKDAAVRFWKQAIRIEPSFAPAHLNLAFAARGSNDARAIHELALAVRFNPLDAYGIDLHVHSLREQLGVWKVVDEEPRWSGEDYQLAVSPLPEEPRRVVQVLRTTSLYMIRWQDRVKALNNAGAYLVHRKHPEHALDPLQEGIRLLVDEGGVATEKALLSTLFENLERGAKDAGFAEDALYAWLKEAYR